MTSLCPATAPTLEGARVRLEQLTPDHLEDLQEAARDGELWNLWYTFVPRPEDMEEEIRRRLDLQEQQQMVPWVVRRQDTGQVTGMTTFMNPLWSAPRVEIGHTWNAASTQRTGINVESKLLLLSYAFEELGCLSVRFCTHRLNRQSRRAIEDLGAQLDGILRSDQRMPDGSVRDTAVYSILREEWPATRNHLQFRLARHQG